MERVSLERIKKMSIADMENQISYAIESMGSNTRAGVDDIIRLLKTKRGLLLADPSKGGKKAQDDLSLWAANEMKALKEDQDLMAKEVLEEVAKWEHPEERDAGVEKGQAADAGFNHLPPHLRGFNTPAKANQGTESSNVQRDPGAFNHLPPHLRGFNTPAKANQG